jgi:glyoxylase-like metal-dependent hydrolase (beta-lactamase superfamily II)
MIVKTLVVGQLESNCHVVVDEGTGHAMVIDPGDEPDRIAEFIKGLDVQYIFITHAHFDHAGALQEIKEATGADIAVHSAELPLYEGISDQAAFWGFLMEPLPTPDIMLEEGDEIILGNTSFVVIHTPGHSPGSISLYGEGAVFTGDTLFAGSVGRTDFAGGDIRHMKASFQRLMSLPPETIVYAGHGPATTIGRERTGNMFSGEFLS